MAGRKRTCLSTALTVLMTIVLTLLGRRLLVPDSCARQTLELQRYRTFVSGDYAYNLDTQGSVSTSSCEDCAFSLQELQVPENGGFLKVVTRKGEHLSFGVSMFHQLHCLEILEAQISGISAHHQSSNSADGPHWQHCFSYLAQSIACAADETIEHPQVLPDPVTANKGEFIIDGIGERHSCKEASHMSSAVYRSEKDPILIEDHGRYNVLSDLLY